MNAKIILLAAAVAVIGAGALMMCDGSEAATGDIIISGSAGTSLNFSLISMTEDDSQLMLKFEGTGNMNNYAETGGHSDSPWDEYRNGIYAVDLPEGMTSIGKHGLYRFTNLTQLTIPSTLTTIDQRGVTYATNMETLEIKSRLGPIGQFAFLGCGATNVIMDPNGRAPTECLKVENLTYTADYDWTESNKTSSLQYLNREHLESITFADSTIGQYALFGQNLDNLTITNASGDDFLGFYVAPTSRATAEDLTVTGLAAQIVRIADVSGSAELVDGGITANDATVHWNTTPSGYATGEVEASPEVLIYPAQIGDRSPYAGLFTAIPLLVIISIVMAIVGTMIIRRD